MTVSCITPPIGHTNLYCADTQGVGSNVGSTSASSSNVTTPVSTTLTVPADNASVICVAFAVALYFLAAAGSAIALLRSIYAPQELQSIALTTNDTSSSSRLKNPFRYLRGVTVLLLLQSMTAAVLGCVSLSLVSTDAQADTVRGLAIASVVPVVSHLLSVVVFSELASMSRPQKVRPGASGSTINVRSHCVSALLATVFITHLVVTGLCTNSLGSASDVMTKSLMATQIIAYVALILCSSLSEMAHIRRTSSPRGFTTLSYITVMCLNIIHGLVAFSCLAASTAGTSASSIIGALAALILAVWSVVIHARSHYFKGRDRNAGKVGQATDRWSSHLPSTTCSFTPTAPKKRLSGMLAGALSPASPQGRGRFTERMSMLLRKDRPPPRTPSMGRKNHHTFGSQPQAHDCSGTGPTRVDKDKGEYLCSPHSTPPPSLTSSPSYTSSPEALLRTPARRSMPLRYVRTGQDESPGSLPFRSPSALAMASPAHNQLHWDARSPGQKERLRMAASYADKGGYQILDFDFLDALSPPNLSSPASMSRSRSYTYSAMRSTKPAPSYDDSPWPTPQPLPRPAKRQGSSTLGVDDDHGSLHDSGSCRLSTQGSKYDRNRDSERVKSSASLWLSFPLSTWLPTPPSSAHGTFGPKVRSSQIRASQAFSRTGADGPKTNLQQLGTEPQASAARSKLGSPFLGDEGRSGRPPRPEDRQHWGQQGTGNRSTQVNGRDEEVVVSDDDESSGQPVQLSVIQTRPRATSESTMGRGTSRVGALAPLSTSRPVTTPHHGSPGCGSADRGDRPTSFMSTGAQSHFGRGGRDANEGHDVHDEDGYDLRSARSSFASSSHPDTIPARRSSCAFGEGSERALDFLASLDAEPVPARVGEGQEQDVNGRDASSGQEGRLNPPSNLNTEASTQSSSPSCGLASKPHSIRRKPVPEEGEGGATTTLGRSVSDASRYSKRTSDGGMPWLDHGRGHDPDGEHQGNTQAGRHLDGDHGTDASDADAPTEGGHSALRLAPGEADRDFFLGRRA